MAQFINPIEPLKASAVLSSDTPIDDAVANLMTTVHRKGRGFVLDTAAGALKRLMPLRQQLLTVQRDIADLEEGKDGARLDVTALAEELDDALDVLAQPIIEVRESLPPHDEFEPKADYRSHVLSDGPSLSAWIKRYGTKEDSIVFIDEHHAVGVLNDTVERGERESASVDWRASEDWVEWSKLVNGNALTHRELYRFLMVHEHNLEDPSLLLALGSVKSTATVNHESEISDSEKTMGVMFKATAGESLVKFPKMFSITLPVLDADTDSGVSKGAKLKVEIVMPSEPMKPVMFRLYCSTWKSIWRQRVRDEESHLRQQLDGWLVLNGANQYSDRP